MTAGNLGTAAVTVTGTGTAALTLAGVTTAGSVDAGALTTVVTANLGGGTSLNNLTTGSNSDVLTTTIGATSTGYTLKTGLGADGLTFGAAGQAQGDMTWDGGGGLDTITFVGSTDIDNETYNLTSVEVIVSGTDLIADASFLDGSSYLFTATGTNTLTIAAMDQASVDLSNMSFTNATNTTAINGSLIGRFNNLDITGTLLVDAIVGGVGDDTIVSGAGIDTYITGGGVDTYTGGVAVDTVTMSAVAGTLNFTGGGTGTDVINAGAGVANTVNILDATIITFNGNTGADTYVGSSLVDDIRVSVNGAGAEADVITTGTGADTIHVQGDTAAGTGAITGIEATTTKITDFSVGVDILELDVTAADYTIISAFNASTAIAGAGLTVVQSFAQGAADVGLTTGLDMLKLTAGVVTTGLTLQAAFNLAIGANEVTGLTASADTFFSMYDTTNSQMIVGGVDTANTVGGGANTAIGTGDTVSLIATLDMTAAEFAAFSSADFAIIA